MQLLRIACKKCPVSSRCARRLLFIVAGCAVTTLILGYEFVLSAIHVYEGSISASEIKTGACPACFGQDFCPRLSRFRRRPEFGRLMIGNGKGVHVGSLSTEHVPNLHIVGLSEPTLPSSVVAKSLGFDSELAKVNRAICTEAKERGMYIGKCNGSLQDSDVSRMALQLSARLIKDTDSFYNFTFAKTSTSMQYCVGPSLHQQLVTAFDRDGDGQLSASEAAVLRTILLVNSEAAILKAFPSEQGWPFPKYFGACGRMIFVENGGAPLTAFLDKPWSVRLKVALAFMDAAIRLTDNNDGWIFYILDMQMENFAAKLDEATGNYIVTLIDAENVVIAKRGESVLKNGFTKDEIEPTAGYGVEPCASTEDVGCLSFHLEQLCAGGHQDMNYFYMCRNMLSQGFHSTLTATGTVFSWRGGLLTKPVANVNEFGRLLSSCIFQKSGRSRRDTFLELRNLVAKHSQQS